MKAVFSNRIQIEGSSALLQEMEEELTYTLPPRIPSDPPMS